MMTNMPRFNGQSIDIEDLLVWAFRDQAVESRTNPHPDARTVYWTVLALPAAHLRVIIRYAKLGSGPEWRAGADRVVSIAAARKSRTLYTEWVRAMVVLQQSLDGTLPGYRVSGPRVDHAPWRSLGARA